MEKESKVLMIHQGSELYGSDRSFVSSVYAMNDCYGIENVEVLLPCKGKINDIISANNIIYRPNGFLRKALLFNNPIKYLYSLIKEARFLSKLFQKYDVIYINTIVCISAILAAKLSSKKVVIHVREIPVGIQMNLFKLVLNCQKFNLIYNSSSTKKAFNIDGAIVLNGVHDIGNAIEHCDKKENSQPKLKCLLIGRLNSWKGQDFFLNSIVDFSHQMEIRIVGGVFEKQHHFKTEIERIIKSNNLPAKLYDFSDNPAEHYEWCDFVVVPSKLPEPFGRVAVEAMAASKPVIAAKHGGLSEIVTSNVNGFLFKPNCENSLQEVISKCSAITAQQYQKMSIAARETYISKFSETAYKANLLKALEAFGF